MSSKKFLLISSILISIILILNTIFLYKTDTYSIANPKAKIYYSSPNQRFLITEHILEKKDNYDTLIFGSSRVGYINPFHIKNTKTYNMSYAEGIPHEHLLLIKLLLKNGMKIKNLLIGLDEASYQVSFFKHQQQLASKSHYLATGDTKFNYYKLSFFRKPTKSDFKHFKKKYILKEGIVKLHNDRIYNAIYEPKKLYSEIRPSTRTKEHINDPRFLKVEAKYDGYELNNAINDIKEIVKIAKENDINTTFIIVPMHQKTYQYTNKKRFYKFREELAKITPFYDFGQPNYISKHNEYWEETSHFTYEVGDMIINRIYDNNTTMKNFGTYIEKKE